jgi:sulfatase maturation enzyme AslB (radical SAM superfamily)
MQVYRESPIFTQLRHREDIKGKCGVCEYLKVCGGSRARAYGMTGDFMESEPFCTHIPKKYAAMVERGEAEPVEQYFEARYRRTLPVADVEAFVSGSAA